jgi:hypothetical protein
MIPIPVSSTFPPRLNVILANGRLAVSQNLTKFPQIRLEMFAISG